MAFEPLARIVAGDVDTEVAGPKPVSSWASNACTNSMYGDLHLAHGVKRKKSMDGVVFRFDVIGMSGDIEDFDM
jgi:hypothetical protein